MHKTWTKEQEEYLRNNYHRKKDRELVGELKQEWPDEANKFTSHTVKKKRQRMGLKKVGNKWGSKPEQIGDKEIKRVAQQILKDRDNAYRELSK